MTLKTRVAMLAVAVLGAVAIYLFAYEPPYDGPLKTSGRPLVFAHRGFGNYAPDNSLAGIRMAMDSGADGVDMDGQLSADLEVVIFHDLSVDRLTEGHGRVSGQTLAQLRQLDLGVKYGHGFAGHADTHVKTLEESLAVTQQRGILMVELKVPGLARTGIEERALDIVRRHEAFEQVYFSSFNPFVLARLKKLEPRIHTVFIFMDTNWNPQLLAEIKPGDRVDLPFFLRIEPFRRALRKWMKPDALSVNEHVAPATIQRLLSHGYPVFLWVPETREALSAALEQRPFGVISDEPNLARELRDARYPRP